MSRSVKSEPYAICHEAVKKSDYAWSYLENRYYNYRTPVHWQAYKKQNNYCNRLYKREREKDIILI